MQDNPDPARRDFLGQSAVWASVLALGTALGGVLRLPKPAVLPGPLRIFKLGDPAQYAAGSVTPMESSGFFLFRDEKGFHAISSVCTHLGCIVAREENVGFACPCHGSNFSADGAVVGGPAPEGLPWLQISLSPDGQLQVNAEAQVARGTKFQV
ncbi:MAG: ubiquinol-cytochrome c reductase iron-sulfur subunit [Acidobacteria bacterium]|nr:ubiquinol-cytochrome c reductase iron-sulfur subunit [Acidobacteriota bacterium]